VAGPQQGNVPPDFLYKQLAKFPRGLLKFFGIPQGQNPQLIESSYQPILDLWEWLACTPENETLILGSNVTSLPGATGTLALLNLSRFMYVHEYTIRSTPVGAGGGSVRLVPSVQPNFNSGVELILGDPFDNFTSSAGDIVVAYARQPFFVGLPPTPGGAAQSALSCIRLFNSLVDNIDFVPYVRGVFLDPPT